MGLGHVARVGEMKNAYKVLVGKPEGKKPFRRPRSRWEDNDRTDLREVWWGKCGLDCISLRIRSSGGLL
jgi:hypothetical protein